MIPIYIFDEHNEAFYFWHKAKKEGVLNEPTDLIHVDAHDDMARPNAFQKSLYFLEDSSADGYLNYYADFAKKELSISNYIFPAVLCGIIRNVYFIFPHWRNLKARRKKMNVSSAFGEGKILKYNLRIDKKPDPRVSKAYPDLTYFNFCMQEIEKIPANRKVILDIDLDYFACIDSVSNHMIYELEITENQFYRKESFLETKSLPYAGLDFNFLERDGKYYVHIGPKKVKEISHLPPEQEIQSEIDLLVSILQRKRIRPVGVTISRSWFSNFCPKDYCELIEAMLKDKLSDFLNP